MHWRGTQSFSTTKACWHRVRERGTVFPGPAPPEGRENYSPDRCRGHSTRWSCPRFPRLVVQRLRSHRAHRVTWPRFACRWPSDSLLELLNDSSLGDNQGRNLATGPRCSGSQSLMARWPTDELRSGRGVVGQAPGRTRGARWALPLARCCAPLGSGGSSTRLRPWLPVASWSRGSILSRPLSPSAEVSLPRAAKACHPARTGSGLRSRGSQRVRMMPNTSSSLVLAWLPVMTVSASA
jgi:hypothetical protein